MSIKSSIYTFITMLHHISMVIFFCLLLLCISGRPGSAATIRAKSPSYDDVSAAVSAASSGDTVKVPAGSAWWNNPLKITKGITLQGAGIGKTVITSNINNRYVWLIAYHPANPSMNEPFEVMGFTIDGGWKSSCLYVDNKSNHPITRIKIHDNRFYECIRDAIHFGGLTPYGVIYHNQFENNNLDFYAGGGETRGWLRHPHPIGSANYPYVEDNTFTYSNGRSAFLTEAGHGGRYVFRYNTVINYPGGDIHDSHGNIAPYPQNRGTVATEIYNNSYTENCARYDYRRLFAHRGGQALVFNNVLTGSGKCYAHSKIGVTEEDEWQFKPPLLQQCPPPGCDPVHDSFYWNNRSTVKNSTAEVGVFVYDNGNGSIAAKYVRENVNFWKPVSGPDANKPRTCAPGSYYGTSDTGRLYKCQSPNTWTLLYAPYQYPHPFRTVGTKSQEGNSDTNR